MRDRGCLAAVGRAGEAGQSPSPRVVAGALVGLPFGLFLGLTLVLFGLLPLASPVVTILLILGPIAGGLWTWWSPLGSSVPAGVPA